MPFLFWNVFPSVHSCYTFYASFIFVLSMKPVERESRFTLTVLLFLTAMVLFLSSYVFVQSKQTQLQLDAIRQTLQQK